MTDEDPTIALARLEAQIATLTEARAKLQRAAELEAEARRLRAEAGVPGDSPLTIGRESDTVLAQMEAESAGAVRSQAQFSETSAKHRFVQMLAGRRLSVKDVADFLKVALRHPKDYPQSSIQSWYKHHKDPAYRAIPEDAARALQEKYGVPLSAWHRRRKPKA